MKNIYNIPKNQLIVIIVFSIIGEIAALANLDSYDGNEISGFLSIAIPFFLIFYVIGWRNAHKDKGFEQIRISENLKPKKILKSIIVTILVIAVLGGGIYIYASNQQKKQEREEYVGTINRFQQKIENAKACVDGQVQALKDKEATDCQEKYDAALANYKDCKSNMPWSSHNECITWPGSNYEQYECSEAAIVNKITETYNPLCYSEVSSDLDSVRAYEVKLTNLYLESLPGTKYLLTTQELQALYDLFPQEVFNEKTKERLNEIVEKNGYKIEI